jgi:predicted ATPase
LMLMESTDGGAASEHHKAAEQCFNQALNLASRQHARSLELRAALSLSRLWRGRHKRTEAKQMLAEICGSFMEGFDTVDLLEAKSIIDANEMS